MRSLFAHSSAAPSRSSRHAVRAAPVLALVLAGCIAVGPDYHAPSAQALRIPDAWHNTSGAPAPATDLSQWWAAFDDETLTGLVREALRDSPNLRAAVAKLREARARRAYASANRFPTLTSGASAARTSASQRAGSGATTSLYDASFDASWEPDVFGGRARALEATSADLEATQANFHATQVSLAAEVALNYVELRAFEARVAIAAANLAAQEETLQLTRWRAQAGLTTVLDVEQANTTVEQTRAQIPALRLSLAQAQPRLAILLGRAPGELAGLVPGERGVPQVPPAIAAGIPAETLRQRPDLRAAERRLAAETARVGQQAALRYPSFALSGSLGAQALTAGALGASGAGYGQLVASTATTLFDGGRLRQLVEIQGAVQEQALRAYEAAVLAALEEVENALAAMARTQERRKSLGEAVASARIAAALARQRYAAGITDFQTVLNTDRTLLTAEDALAASAAEHASAAIQLYKALGGGWTTQRADAR